MAGGRAEHIERVRPVVMHLAARFTRMGGSGAGQALKGGFADSAPLQIFGARMAARRFDPPLAAIA